MCRSDTRVKMSKIFADVTFSQEKELKERAHGERDRVIKTNVRQGEMCIFGFTVGPY